MKKFTLISILASALLTLGSSALSAQEAKVKRADTLRRELTVMTEDEVTLGTRQPLGSPHWEHSQRPVVASTRASSGAMSTSLVACPSG